MPPVLDIKAAGMHGCRTLSTSIEDHEQVTEGWSMGIYMQDPSPAALRLRPLNSTSPYPMQAGEGGTDAPRTHVLWNTPVCVDMCSVSVLDAHAYPTCFTRQI